MTRLEHGANSRRPENLSLTKSRRLHLVSFACSPSLSKLTISEMFLWKPAGKFRVPCTSAHDKTYVENVKKSQPNSKIENSVW